MPLQALPPPALLYLRHCRIRPHIQNVVEGGVVWSTGGVDGSMMLEEERGGGGGTTAGAGAAVLFVEKGDGDYCRYCGAVDDGYEEQWSVELH
mmetsp:Transcript_15909/g.22618  ORF Transcript_15909/g.22618 Transcript_15909/m.22618 type:complete len:93 (-) Transcript_15909:38-316(-)